MTTYLRKRREAQRVSRAVDEIVKLSEREDHFSEFGMSDTKYVKTPYGTAKVTAYSSQSGYLDLPRTVRRDCYTSVEGLPETLSERQLREVARIVKRTTIPRSTRRFPAPVRFY